MRIGRTIRICLGNQLIANALYQLLVTNPYDDVIMGGTSSENGSSADVLLVDTTTLRHGPLEKYPLQVVSFPVSFLSRITDRAKAAITKTTLMMTRPVITHQNQVTMPP